MRQITQFFFALIFTSLLVFSTGCSSEVKLKRSLARADRYFDAGELSKAEVEYMNALQISQNPHAIGRLGSIYYDQGRVGRAYGFLTKAAELSTNDVELNVKLAAINLAVGKPKEARAAASFVLDQDPKHSEAPLLLAESTTTPKEVRETRQKLESISTKIGETAPIQLALGILQLRERDIKAAEVSVKRALALDPKSSAAHHAMGNLYLAQNDLKNAEPEFKAAAELAPVRSARRLAYADFKIKTGELEEGKKLLVEISKELPDYLPTWIRQAEIALAEKKFDECESFLKQVLSRDGENIEGLLLRGRLLLAQGNPDKSIADLERTSKMFQEKVPQAHYLLAMAHLLNNDSTKAFRSVNQSLALNTNSVDAILLQARINLTRGDSAAAIASLTPVIKQQPQNAQAYLLLADGHLAQKNPSEAASVFRKMMTLFPKDPQVPFLLGSVLLQQNKTGEARKAFEQSRELAPDYLPALERLVDLDLVDKAFTTATDRVNKQLEKYPNTAGPWLIFAKIHMTEKKVDQAESALLKSIEIDSTQRTPYLLLSRIYLDSNRQKEALEKLNTLVTKQTNDIAAFMQIGMIHDEMRNFPAARDVYEKLLGINPNFAPALNNLAYLYSEHLIDLDKAYKYAERARQISRGDPLMTDTLGWILYKRGDYPRALSMLRESASKLVTEPEVQFHLGMTHYMLGNMEPARVALERSMAGQKDFLGKEQGETRLAILSIDPKTADVNVVKNLEKALQDEPNDPVVPGLIAAIYERTGAVDKAVNSYEKALKQNPKSLPALRGLIRLYTTKVNEPKKAFELAKTANGIAPEDAEIAHVLGRMYYDAGDYKRSLGLLQDAARRLPGEPELLYNLSLAFYQNGQDSQAQARLQEAVQLGNFAQLNDAKRFLAFISVQTPDQAGAVAAQAAQALKTDPNYIPALMISALVQEQNKPNQAKDLYEKVLRTNPLFVPAVRNLAILHAESVSNDSKAWDIALKARSAYPSDPAVARALGILAYRKGDFTRSVSLLKESARQNANDAALHYYLGMAQYQLKDWAASKISLTQAVKLNLPENLAADAKQKLAEIGK